MAAIRSCCISPQRLEVGIREVCREVYACGIRSSSFEYQASNAESSETRCSLSWLSRASRQRRVRLAQTRKVRNRRLFTYQVTATPQVCKRLPPAEVAVFVSSLGLLQQASGSSDMKPRCLKRPKQVSGRAPTLVHSRLRIWVSSPFESQHSKRRSAAVQTAAVTQTVLVITITRSSARSDKTFLKISGYTRVSRQLCKDLRASLNTIIWELYSCVCLMKQSVSKAVILVDFWGPFILKPRWLHLALLQPAGLQAYTS